MTPSDHTGGDGALDIDLGVGIDVEVSVEDEATADRETIGLPGGASDSDGGVPATSYLVEFDPGVTPDDAEAVLGRLSPPEEGIILAGSGAVIVRARREFVEFAECHRSVTLVNEVRLKQWEPNRHRVRADPD